MKGAPLKPNRAESKHLSAFISLKECCPGRRARIIAAARVPLGLHQRVGLSGAHALLAVQPVEKRRDPPVHDAVDVDGSGCRIQCRHKRREMSFGGGIERHRDVAVTDPQFGQLPGLSDQRFGMIVKRQIDHMAHADCGEPGRVSRCQAARRGDAATKPLPTADVIGIVCDHGVLAIARFADRSYPVAAMIESATLAGQFLLAMPGMGDPRFHRAVIAMMVHDSEGALGIGLGRVHPGFGLHELLADLDIDPGQAPDCPVLDGGPVEPQRGFVLHSLDWDGPDTIAAGELCALSASLEVLRAIAEGRGPARFLVALGYAGWDEGQLDAELQCHGWQVIDGNRTILFDTAAEDRWTAGWQSLGIDPAVLSGQTGRA